MASRDSEHVNPKSRRRWLQFSLRTLLVFILLTGIGASWLALRIKRAQEQREAVQAIGELGGFVSYDYQFD